MLFTSFEFVAFLACVLVLYYLIPVRFQWILLLVANVFFYARSGLYGLLFMGVTIVTSYAAARIMSAVQYHMDDTVKAHKEVWSKQERKAYKQQMKRKKRMIFIGCLLVNLGILAVLKYTNFAIANVNSIAALFTGRHSIARVNLVLPPGISFYTFQTMGYVIDVYRSKAEAEKNIFKMALFTSFFPQLIQGPISRFGELSQTLYAPHRFDFRKVWFGLERVLWGYFKKLVIADRIVVAVNAIVGQPDIYSGFYVFCSMLFYAAELYADFTGGIDITIGIAQMFGIQLAENFERPYFSKNIAEYWRRWHITMGTWFKDYLFYPLSASMPVLSMSTFCRKHFGVAAGRRIPVYFVTLVVWFATGIWHGASWNFIVWGLLNAVVILLSQECRPLYEKFHARFPGIQKKYAYRIFQVVRTVLLMSSLRMLDCYRNVGLTFKMFGTMFTDWNMTAAMKGLLQLGLTAADYAVVAVAVVLVLCVSLKQRRGSIREQLYERTAAVQYLVVFALLFAILIFGAYGIGYDANQFIYNQF